MPYNPAIFGRQQHRTGVFGNSIFGRIGVASGLAVVPIEALGYVLTYGPDVTYTLALPRGPASPGLVGVASGISIPEAVNLPVSLFRRSPTRANIRFTEGTTYRIGLNFVDMLNNPINLNGAVLVFNVYQRAAPQQGALPILQKTLGSGIQVISAILGQSMVTFLYTDTHDLPGIYDWEIQITESLGDIYAPGMGVLIITPSRRQLQ